MMYDTDPADWRLTLGSQLEPRMIDRRRALIEIYARRILVHYDADPDRLESARRDFSARHAPPQPRHNAERHDLDRQHQSEESLTPPETSTSPPPPGGEPSRLWAVAEELAEAALTMV